VSYQRWFRPTNEFTLGRRTFVLCPVFCVLSLAFLCFTTSPSLATSDGWAATYGGIFFDEAHSVQQTGDGGYLVAGWTRSSGAGDADFLVLKLRSDGTVEWQKTYGGDSWDEARSIRQTSEGGYIVAGWTMSFGAGLGDLWVLKLGADGAIEWQNTYGGGGEDLALSIQQTGDKGYIVTGVTSSFGAGSSDVWVLKLRPDGKMEWQKTYGGDGVDRAFSIQQTGDGGYIVAGDTISFALQGQETPDVWILKLKSDGAVEWQKIYGGDNYDQASSVRQTSDGGYVAAGRTDSFGAGGGDVWVLKLGSDGAVAWQRTYGGVGLDEASSIQQTGNGGYIMAGNTASSGAWGVDALVLELSPDGAVEWQKTYGGVDDDWAFFIQQTSDGGYIITGGTRSFGAGEDDLWVLKLRPDGSIDDACDFIRATGISEKNSNTPVRTTNADVSNSGVNPQDSSAAVQDINASVNFLCASTAVE